MKTTYNIVCVTARGPSDSFVHFHLRAQANTATLEDNKVEYCGKTYPLKYVASGLSGSAVLLGLVSDDGVLELYTDTPVEDGKATPESIRAEAEHMMRRQPLNSGMPAR